MDERRLVVSVDLEFFDSPFRFRGRATPPPGVETVGIAGVEFIADCLEAHGCTGTFFVLGELAEAHPELVATLADRGHEIASHGYSKSHPDLRKLDQSEVEQEVERSKSVLEEIIDASIEGYRAPAFALDETVLAAVADSGHRYDSSIVPGRRIPGFYGMPGAPDRPFATGERFEVDGLTELPVTVSPYLRLPISGAWMRLLGRRYTLWGLRSRLARDGYAMVYIHPWELVDLPRHDPIPSRVYWRTGTHARETMRQVIERFADEIGPAASVIDALEQ